ncbi:MAG: hypothetical protein NW203_01125 [Hyphomonadaceae bacterium]|nr:hypothetical protein [Hyphomonadaceae bacterium]
MARLLLAALAGAMALFAALAFDAASATRQALALGAVARDADEQDAQALAYGHARAVLAHAWSQPLVWHAGAIEAASWIAALQAQADANRAAHQAESARAAARGLRLSPVQPIAWARMAALGPAAQSFCAPDVCLDRSWRAAKMLDAESACARVRVAHGLGALDAVDADPRALWFAMAASPEQTTACVAFAPRDAVFRLLIEGRKANVLQREREAARAGLTP